MRQGASEEKLSNFAILPPYLAEEIFEDDSLEAIYVLWQFIKKIKKLRSDSDEDSAVVEVDPEQLGNASPRRDESEDGPQSATELADEKAAFHKILVSGAVMQDHKSVPGTPVIVCHKKFTKNWEDEQHRAHIKSAITPQSSIPANQKQQQGYSELTDQLEELHNNLMAKKL